ncbi:MAG: type I methionyl aminopeptidase [Patescibacteria group bacterium]
MSILKTPAEIAALKEGGEILSRALRAAAEACVEGAHTEALDAIARKVIEDAGGKPSFLEYRIGGEGTPFPGTLCISINDEVVHGLPTPDRVIKKGDIVSLDIGCWYKDLCTDMATTVIVGETNKKTKALVEATRESLVRGLSVIKAGRYIHDIGAAIEDYLKPQGYGIVKDLVGHGVGHAVHEEPQVPNYRERHAPKIKLLEGMVLAIEPMVTLGDWHVHMKEDEWTIATNDGSICAHFELTVAVTKNGYELITPWPDA